MEGLEKRWLQNRKSENGGSEGLMKTRAGGLVILSMNELREETGSPLKYE